jgi:beta-lactam-binding protein with PASTA domain
MGFFKFVRSRYFWIHTGLAIVLTIFLMWFTLKALGIYTKHGQSIDVPDFKGKTISELPEYADDYDVTYEIIDSVYDSSLPKGSVIMQDPAAGTKVKDGRRIYLTVVAMKQEMVQMPDLLDLTLRQASAMLETYGLLVGKLKYVPDIARNAVLQQKFKGERIEEGTLIAKGSKIDLVLGQGEENEKVEVPDVYGMKQGEALRMLKVNSLNVGNEIFEDGPDTTVSRVYKVKPGIRSVVNMGTTVDIYYKSEKKHDFTK